jgi:asparagine synthase (glutamine-hydrolysing)
MDQPTSDGVNTFVVSKAAAASGFNVALSGIGGDELFGGYPSFRAVPLLEGAHGLAGKVGRRVAATLAWTLPPGERRKKLRRWFMKDDLDGDAYDLVRELFSPTERGLLGRQWAGPHPWPSVVRHKRLSFGDVSSRELSEYMRNVLLRDTDCFSMACSLEIREPYLHVPMVEFAMNLPDAWKTGRSRKALLRDAFADVLPASVFRGPKRGFTLPFRVWLRDGPLRGEVERTLLDPNMTLLDAKTVRAVWNDFQRGRTSWNRVWALYVLQKWAAANLGD